VQELTRKVKAGSGVESRGPLDSMQARRSANGAWGQRMPYKPGGKTAEAGQETEHDDHRSVRRETDRCSGRMRPDRVATPENPKLGRTKAKI